MTINKIDYGVENGFITVSRQVITVMHKLITDWGQVITAMQQIITDSRQVITAMQQTITDSRRVITAKVHLSTINFLIISYQHVHNLIVSLSTEKGPDNCPDLSTLITLSIDFHSTDWFECIERVIVDFLHGNGVQHVIAI
jgi:hypothetical protein